MAAVVLSSCDSYERTNPLDPNYPMTVTLLGPDSVFSLNETVRFQLVTEPAHPDLPFVWTTSEPELLTMGQGTDGTFTALGNGIVHVSAAYGPRVAEKQVVIQQRPVSFEILDPEDPTFASLGERKQLQADAVDANGVPVQGVLGALSWSTSNPAVATVSSSGQVEAVANGSVWIRASAAGEADSVLLTVKQVPATIEFDDDEYEIPLPGTAVQTRVTVDDARGNPLSNPEGLTLTSSNPTFSVNAGGRVQAQAWGSTQIVAQIGALSDTAIVRVIGGSAPFVTRLVPAITSTDRTPTTNDFLIVELRGQDAELDLDRAIVDVYSNANFFMTQRVLPLPQGVGTAPATMAISNIAGARQIRVRLNDAALNASVDTAVNVTLQPQAGAPDVAITLALATAGNNVHVQGMLIPGTGEPNLLHLVGFNPAGDVVFHVVRDLSPAMVDFAITGEVPAGQIVEYVGVIASDREGRFSRVRTFDLPVAVTGVAAAATTTGRGAQ